MVKTSLHISSELILSLIKWNIPEEFREGAIQINISPAESVSASFFQGTFFHALSFWLLVVKCCAAHNNKILTKIFMLNKRRGKHVITRISYYFVMVENFHPTHCVFSTKLTTRWIKSPSPSQIMRDPICIMFI